MEAGHFLSQKRFDDCVRIVPLSPQFPVMKMHAPQKQKVLLASLLLFTIATDASAQLAGSHLLGDAGLQSGTQSEPSIAPLLIGYNYHTKTFVDKDGDKHDLSTSNYGSLIAGGMWVTNLKILGGNLGGCALIAFTNSKTEGGGVSSKTPFSFSDSYITPAQLGWSTEHADFTADYSLYIPSGAYELNSEHNTGMGMWTHEFSAGSTLYLDKDQSWTVSALIGYAINSRKRNTGNNRIVVGNHLTVEGGLGKSWELPAKKRDEPWLIGAGMVYYFQFKTTKDQMEIPELRSTPIFLDNKDHVLALGIEGNVYIPMLRSNLSIRWFDEIAAKNRLQGNSFLVTLIPCAKILHPKKQAETKS